MPSDKDGNKSNCHAWPLVMCLVGLDYFSTLAYLPSIAASAAGPLAPLAALAIVFATLFLAVPLYMFVVGRSPHGQGASGLIERAMPGWRGKLIVLALMGFVAADFIITRSLSVADGSTHLLNNGQFHAAIEHLGPGDDAAAAWFGPRVWPHISPFWTRQIALTIALSTVAFGLWFWLHGGFTRNVLRLAAAVVTVYLAMSGLIVGSGVLYLARHVEIVSDWFDRTIAHGGGIVQAPISPSLAWLLLTMSLASFPQLALGLSGFELSMSIAPLVRGAASDTPASPRGRIRNVRRLMASAAIIMSLYVVGSITVVSLLIPGRALEAGGAAEHRALAYLAHGGELSNGDFATSICPWFGAWFGTLHDAATVSILMLAGASVMIGLRDLVPQYLHRMGMELNWAHRVGVMLHLFNVIILVVTVVFQASVTAQQWAYATSVLALLSGASIAAVADLRQRWRGSPWRMAVMTPFLVICGFFLGMTCLSICINASGLAIALLFVAAIFCTSFVSRWLRSTELRFSGFDFADEFSRQRWHEIQQMEFQLLVPHRPGHFALSEKHRDVRRVYRLPDEIPLFFIEANLGDTSEFYQRPLLKIAREDNLEVIRVTRCVSVSHVIAAIGLELRHVGRPPEIYFGWSHETPLAANLSFLLMGQGNVPWMVKELIRKAEPDPARQPRVIVG